MRKHYLYICLVTLGLLLPGLSPAATNSSLRRTPTVVAVEQTSPAVVNISTEKLVRSRSAFGRSGDPFFDQFFRDFLDPFPRRQYKQNSLGSGIIFDQQGYILTNYHVIQKASRITVTLTDNREFEGEVIGADANSDLAVVKLTAKETLPTVMLGTSEDLMIGEPVIAIGNPFGLSHTITTGVISALNRSIRVSDEQVLHGFIQTDAPINPGNSGGPLINILGEVIGINTAIYGNAQGIGFAIPIDKARRIAENLIEYGEVRRAWLGISIQDITPAIAQYFNYQSTGGVLVSQIVTNSSAEQSGLRQGDIITSLNGQPVQDQQGYRTLLAEYTAGSLLTLTVIREGQPITLKIEAEEFSPEQAALMVSQDFGIHVEEITRANANQYRLRSTQGVLITKVRPQSPAAQVGIEPGDVIRQIEGVQVNSLTDVRDILMKIAQQARINVLVQRRNRGYYVTLERQ